MIRLLNSPILLWKDGKIDEFEGFRDSLILELLYGGGLRVSELCALKHGEIDLGQGVARVFGKGRKERLCPLGPVAIAMLESSLSTVLGFVRGARITWFAIAMERACSLARSKSC